MIVTRARAKYIVGFLGLLVLILIMVLPARPAGAQTSPEADLSVQKFDFPPEQVAVGETLFYELAIANLGPDTATNAVVTDTLPTNTEFLFTFSGDCTNVGQTVTCNLGDLAPNEQAFVEFAVCPTEPGTAVNTATASSDTPDPDSSNNTATETTEVTTPAVGACPSQEPDPPPDEPQPDEPQPDEPTPDGPQPEPTPPPVQPQPDEPQPEPTLDEPTTLEPAPQPALDEPVANACSRDAGAAAIRAQDFSVACAGGQVVAAQGDVSDDILIRGEPIDGEPEVGQAVARTPGALAVADGEPEVGQAVARTSGSIVHLQTGR